MNTTATGIDTARQGEQQWYLQQADRPANANVYRLVSVHDNDWANAICLGAHGDHPTAGAVVDTYGCDPNGIDQPNQEWIFDNHAKLTEADSGAVWSTVNTAVGDDLNGYSASQNAFVMFNAAMLARATTRSPTRCSASKASR